MTAKASSMRKAEAAVKNVGRLAGDFVATLPDGCQRRRDDEREGSTHDDRHEQLVKIPHPHHQQRDEEQGSREQQFLPGVAFA